MPKGKGYPDNHDANKGFGRMSKNPTKPSPPAGGKDYLKDYSPEDFNRGYRKP